MNLQSILIFLSIMALSPVNAQDAGPARLPDLYIFHYEAPKRDPFISSSAPRTLVNADAKVRGIASGSVVQKYLQTISAAIQRELFIGGVSIGDENTRSIALINGVPFARGDRIPLPIGKEQLLQLDELAKTYGLPLERGEGSGNNILVEVGEIKSGGVSIVLPGFKAAICELPYEGDLVPQAIQLERKRTTP
jgi:hypothetical protein